MKLILVIFIRRIIELHNDHIFTIFSTFYRKSVHREHMLAVFYFQACPFTNETSIREYFSIMFDIGFTVYEL